METNTVETVTKTPIDWGALWQTILNWLTTTGIRLVIGILLMIVLFKVINVISKKLYRRLEDRQVDETILRAGTGAFRVALQVLVTVCFVGYIGVETASISACIATLGVGISLAVQGTLSNFAGGVILIVMRPFKVGDFITSSGNSGTVEDIKMFYTVVVTPDNRVIYLPNGSLANNVIVNASVKDDRRVDLVVPIAYEADSERARSIILSICEAWEPIYKTPEPFVEIGELAGSSVNLTVRVWCKSSDYWNVHFFLLSEIKAQFDADGIVIPYNQLDVHINNKD